jgi:hypothetical protein
MGRELPEERLEIRRFGDFKQCIKPLDSLRLGAVVFGQLGGV